jgi:hypothetical protein
MSRRPAQLSQADIARAVRAAKQAGAKEVEVRLTEGSTIIIRMDASRPAEPAEEALAQYKDVVL